MSSLDRVVVTCPACGNAEETTIWVSVNVTLDSKLREAVLRGDLNTFACSRCSKAAIISNDLLYHDMRRKFMIWQMRSGTQDAKPLKDPVLEEEEEFLADYRLRIVTSRSQLIEKILAFEDNLDDRVIEVLKVMILKRLDRYDGKQNDQLVYRGLSEKPPEGKALVFTPISETGEAEVILIPWEEGYRAVETDLDRPRPPVKTKPTWLAVDRAFAFQYAPYLRWLNSGKDES